jgi:hypothetical protein
LIHADADTNDRASDLAAQNVSRTGASESVASLENIYGIYAHCRDFDNDFTFAGEQIWYVFQDQTVR